MRTHNSSTYHFPTLESCCPTYLHRVGQLLSSQDNADDDDDNGEEEKCATEPTITTTTQFCYEEESIAFDLKELPLLNEDGGQNPVGAQGWYASAVLSAMLLLGHNHLHQDLHEAMQRKKPGTQIPLTVLELGSGAVGLSGMAMAWYLAQHQLLDERRQQSRIVLTDYDSQCLKQLEQNTIGVQESFENHSSKEFIHVPDIRVQRLDWQDYEEEQSVLNENCGSIDMVLGAALVYTEENSCCSSQIAKILRDSPRAVVWIVQYPRDGWFQVLQLQLQRLLPRVDIRKFHPTEIHPQVHALAQTLMTRQIGAQYDVQFIKAIRISLIVGEDESI